MKKLKFFFTVLMFISLSSCKITESMWNEHYDEDIRRFLISGDGSTIVFLSENYHYIIYDNTGIVKRLLFSPHRYLLMIDTSKTHLILDENNEINANVAIKLTTLAPPRDAEAFFYSMGFQRDGKKRPIFLKMKLLGKRYLAPENISTYVHTLNSSYKIEVRYRINETQRMQKAALTPITMTLDAVLLIGKTVLLPFANN